MLKRLAMDKSLREYDHDNRLHVELTPISKANICPYFGREIPNSEALGLKPDRIYQMFRDPDELRKAAETSNGIQLMQVHDPVSTDEPKQMKVVGAIGTDAIFDPPYLKNSIHVWTASAIKWIETGAKKQLSSAYHYVADMTPGVYMGVNYDGVMRDIKFNHVAIVEDGRAGADVMVVDALPPGLAYDHMPFLTGDKRKMPKSTATTSPRALVARCVVKTFLQPMLASDQAIDYKALLLGSTANNWDEAKPIIMSRIKSATKGKLAKDANLDVISSALDILGSDEDMEAMDEDEEEEKAKDKKAKDKKAKDESEEEMDDDEDEEEKVTDKKKAKDKKAKDEKEDEEEMKSKDKKAKDKKAKDEWPDKDDDEDDEDEKAKDRKAKDVMAAKPITKAAMDRAIQLAQDEAIEQTRLAMRQEQRELREAEAIVKPVLGELIAQDSALDVYSLLFKDQGVETKGVTKTVPNYRALAQLTVKAANKPKAQPRMAHDSKAVKGIEERFGVSAVRRV